MGKSNPCSEQKRISISNSLKPVGGFKQVKSPTGKIMDIGILSDFCKINNLTISSLSELLHGKIKKYKGWVLVDNPV